MTNHDKLSLPIAVSEQVRGNPYIMSGLATRAFQLAGYDMTPDKPVEAALRQGLIVVEKPDLPMKIKRMPGNGSFA